MASSHFESLMQAHRVYVEVRAESSVFHAQITKSEANKLLAESNGQLKWSLTDGKQFIISPSITHC